MAHPASSRSASASTNQTSLIGIYANFPGIAFPNFHREHDDFHKGIIASFYQNRTTCQAMEFKKMGPHWKVMYQIEKEIKTIRAARFDSFVLPDVNLVFHEEAIPRRMQETKQPLSIFTLHTWGYEGPLAVIEHNLITQVTTALCDDKWVSLADCLSMSADRLQPGEMIQTHESRNDDMRRWWAANGKHFPLQKLAPELRNGIYRAAFGPTIKVPSKAELKSRKRFRYPFDWTENNFNLFRVNKQVNKEVGHIVYNKIVFDISEPRTLHEMSMQPRQISRIKHLRLEVGSAYVFFKVFVEEIHSANVHERGQAHPMWILQSMVNLESLEIVMPKPMVYETDDKVPYTVCQTVIVQWILTGMWDKVRGHNVTISGYAKNAQKQDFEECCAIERAKFLTDRDARVAAGKVGPIGDMDDSEEEDGMSLEELTVEDSPTCAWDEAQLPPEFYEPVCECEIRCSRDDWKP